jgi:hypothetical protein
VEDVVVRSLEELERQVGGPDDPVLDRLPVGEALPGIEPVVRDREREDGPLDEEPVAVVGIELAQALVTCAGGRLVAGDEPVEGQPVGRLFELVEAGRPGGLLRLGDDFVEAGDGL